jgi:predicted ATP-grasp superfamily ATP-dependent carboligase
LNHNRPGAIIAGGHYHSLGAARNLAKHGVSVYVVDSSICVAQFSRHVRGFFRAPATDDEAAYCEFFLKLAERPGLGGAILFPSDDESVRIFALHRDALSECYLVTTPPWDVIKYVYDKRLTYRLATQVGVPAPDTCNPANIGDLDGLDLEFPLVVKPAISTHLSAATKKKAYRANDREELRRYYREMAAIMDPGEILIQELIPGRGANLFSYFGFFRGGKAVAGYCAQRPRQHPMEFGRASTLAVTVNIPELEALGEKLLSGIGYSGLAEVEFMYDPKHARFELLDINPRIWGWHTLAIHAGIDLPFLAYADAIGQPVSVGTFREGVKWVRMTTDILTVVSEMWHGRLTLGGYLKSLRGCKDAVFTLSDPLPALMEVLLIPYYAKHRGF